MATKDISDRQVCEAYRDSQAFYDVWPCDLLRQRTVQCEKVVYRAMERAERRGLIDSGVTLRQRLAHPEG